MAWVCAGIAMVILCMSCVGTTCAATSPPPSDFGGVPFGTTLSELKQRHPEVSRNPDSDRQFQVYQTLDLKGVSTKSAAAFNIYKGRVVGGQVMLDSYNARFWYDKMVEQYGKPDTCDYCGDPELVIANWMWGNGVRLHIGGEMLTLLTEEGATQRHDWIARGDNPVAPDSGDEESDLGEAVRPVVHRRVTKKKKIATPPRPAPAPTIGWSFYYERAKNRFERWAASWSK
ncbi:MAG: hypothetical protein JO121_07935 [Deltaproteobacteria bacterium]|nr:hypothetical protein [Deltaproteobacteria bacterium]